MRYLPIGPCQPNAEAFKWGELSPSGNNIADQGSLRGRPIDGADEVEQVIGLDEDVVVGLDDERRLGRPASLVQPLEAHQVLVAQVVVGVNEVSLFRYNSIIHQNAIGT